MTTYSRTRTMAEEMYQIDRELNMPPWDEVSPSIKNRFRRYAKSALENLRRPTTRQVDYVLKRFPDLPVPVIRQVWKDMIDAILRERHLPYV